ncbi:hypothetical protein CCUS01_16821 [Colletotrichum cuscutae]|uniref:Uncharacterized protein n=1 Tax=Colletotrichum cuscutae TaxID=1209917 RepID=A0AAI9VAE7_9PEZI|nr:hypothetical protein CCUS01_16821 [Colletotrichum cuscutae]
MWLPMEPRPISTPASNGCLLFSSLQPEKRKRERERERERENIEENQASLRMPRPSLVSSPSPICRTTYFSVWAFSDDALEPSGIKVVRCRTSIRFDHALLGRGRVPVNSNLHRCFVSRTWIGLGQIYGGFVTNQVSSALGKLILAWIWQMSEPHSWIRNQPSVYTLCSHFSKPHPADGKGSMRHGMSKKNVVVAGRRCTQSLLLIRARLFVRMALFPKSNSADRPEKHVLSSFFGTSCMADQSLGGVYFRASNISADVENSQPRATKTCRTPQREAGLSAMVQQLDGGCS